MSNVPPIMDKALLTMENPEDIERYFNDQAKFHFAKLNVETIDDFNGDFGFLNNEYEAEVYYEGLLYPNVYSAFQASRSSKEFIRKQISEAKSSYEVYSLSQQIEDPKDWPSRRLKVMESLIRDKFTRHLDLKQELIATGNRMLVNKYAHETSSNLFWGKVKNKGSNYLGIILMNIREEIFKNQNLMFWLYNNIELPQIKQLYPEFKVRLSFQSQLIKIDVLDSKSYYFIGSSKKDDMVIGHEAVDGHAMVLAFDTKKGLIAVKTNINGEIKVKDTIIPYLIPTCIKNKSIIHFNDSVSIQIECMIQKIQDYLQKRQRDMEYELKTLESQATNPNKDEIVMASYGISENKTLFVSGFKSIAEKELRDIFKVFGDVDSIRIPVDKYTGKDRGFAFVTFRNTSATQTALKTPLYHNEQKLIVKVADRRSVDLHKEFNEKPKKHVTHQLKKTKRSPSKRSSISNSSLVSISSNSSMGDESSLSSSRSQRRKTRNKNKGR